jgi:DNA-binding protein H-NS
MNDLIEIQSQIEKLQKQATEIKSREFDKTVQDILAKMSAFGIALKDLQPGKSRKSGKSVKGAGKSSVVGGKRSSLKAKSKNAGVSVSPKYRGPNGEGWSGRGLMPRWLAALVAQGQAREDFLIKL